MSKTETVMDLSIEFWRDSQGTSMYPNTEGMKEIDEFVAAIKDLVRGMIPKESNRYNRADRNSITSYNEGYDDGNEAALAEMRKRVEEL